MLLKDGRGRKFSMLKVNRLILPKCCTTAVLGKLVFDRRNEINNLPDQKYENLKHLELTAYFGGISSLGVAFLLIKMFSKIETLRVSLSGGCTKRFRWKENRQQREEDLTTSRRRRRRRRMRRRRRSRLHQRSARPCPPRNPRLSSHQHCRQHLPPLAAMADALEDVPRPLLHHRPLPSFVDSALRHRDPAVPLRSFSLVAASADSDRAQLPSWIRRAAASTALERLTVRTYAQNHQHLGIVSPAVIRRHSSFIVIDVFRLCLPSLRVLELAFPGGGITHVHWPATAFLPSLQGLDLANLTLFLAAGTRSRAAARRSSTAGCRSSPPRLPSSTEVRVRQEIAPSGPAYLKLSAPGLRTLEWVGPLPRSAAVDAAADALVSTLVMRTCWTLVEHDLKKMLLKDGRGRKLSMLKVNRLILPKCCITAVLGKLVFDRRNQVNNPPDQEYENLKHLELIAYFGGSSSLGVAFLLKTFSKIETLRVSLSRGCTKDLVSKSKLD
uniref:Uncharacterized protein n=1 Tax=Ananas comosus var. bracteatus TaxID=296719 RepID=A0A6V7QWK4_ANACO